MINSTNSYESTSVPTTLVDEDTDLLVLLLFNAEPNMLPLYFHPEGKKNTRRPKLWPIYDAVLTLGSRICNCLGVGSYKKVNLFQLKQICWLLQNTFLKQYHVTAKLIAILQGAVAEKIN